MRIVIIGGGAAGFFTAINIKEKRPDAEVIILEKTSNVLQKVKVSGGGRCNVTNGRTAPGQLVPFYPRGGKKLFPVFKSFGTKEMRQWLLDHGVPTAEEADHRVFPQSNSSQTIIDCFLKQCATLGINIRQQMDVQEIRQAGTKWTVQCKNETLEADAVVLATGASGRAWAMLQKLGLKLNAPVPSLFTFHIKDARLADLQGLSFADVQVKVAGTKLAESGPMLITHWGLSGPAILKLSAWGARELAAVDYTFALIINFVGRSFAECQADIAERMRTMPKRKTSNMPPEGIPSRFWERLVTIAGINEKVFGELSKSQINKLCEELTQAHFQVKGKSAFKEEFVTCGGVDLSEIDLNTLEAKRFHGLYLAGEVLDIDALTGGFNFQACWSAGWLISSDIATR
jgi:hypothetical protein